MKKAALYIRVSTQEQASEGYSIEAQRDKLMSFCRLKDWSIQDIYVDGGFSGTNMDRPQLERLLGFLEDIDIVLVYKLDRLSRSQKDILHLVEEKFLANGIDFVSIMESFDTSSAFGKAMIGILAVFAQLERETIIERTKLGKERRAKEGYWNGGPAPIGYDLIDGQLIVNEFEALQIRKVFELYKNHGQNKTAQILNKMGYKTKYGDWKGKSIGRIVSNPIYIGMVHYKDEIFQGKHEPIITEDKFSMIQKVVNSRSKPRVTRSKYLLGGLLWCGYCGARLKSSFSTTGNKGKRFYYYLCYSVSKTPLHMVKDPNCHGHYWKMSDLEEIVLREVQRYQFDKNMFIDEYHNFYSSDRKGILKEIHVLENKVLDLQKQIDKLMTLFQLDKIPFQTISERIEELYVEKKALEKNIEKSVANQNTEKIDIPLHILLNIFENFNLIWDEATTDEKKQILNLLIKKIIVTDSVKIEWNI
ncbi:recombinase family protein [Wukongibacter baidiensis]|uniref:recombinase family protein n=1 Tax=Wukongibacter baidiensis TaxID=1723361 RepID=UPI003D7F8135